MICKLNKYRLCGPQVRSSRPSNQMGRGAGSSAATASNRWVRWEPGWLPSRRTHFDGSMASSRPRWDVDGKTLRSRRCGRWTASVAMTRLLLVCVRVVTTRTHRSAMHLAQQLSHQRSTRGLAEKPPADQTAGPALTFLSTADHRAGPLIRRRALHATRPQVSTG